MAPTTRSTGLFTDRSSAQHRRAEHLIATGAFTYENLGYSSTKGVFAEVLRKVRCFEQLDGRAKLVRLSVAARAAMLKVDAASMVCKPVDVKQEFFAKLCAQPSIVVASC